MKLVNVALLKNPLNWVIILLMLTIVGFAMNEIFRFLSPGDATGCGCSSRQPIPASSIAQ